ncbi:MULTISPECIES: hypothetical protein [Streptomyces]|uniref:Uncharacterized protein n=1 Tax=Streptomyces osmaniensis TaxID=593134 RepID=A0ABP6XII9_9ACTN|nr:hypothetical protein KJK32_29160 [Streptomyces sp. JCM17656]
MALWMTWELEGVGTAAQAVENVDEAARWLVGSVERSKRAFEAEWRWRRLMDSALRVRARMLDEGRETVREGVPWSLTDEGVEVRLAVRE